MSKVYLVDGSTMDALADAIQEKAGITSKLTPAQMIDTVRGLQSGGGGSSLFATTVTDIPANHIVSVIALNATTEIVEEEEE